MPMQHYTSEHTDFPNCVQVLNTVDVVYLWSGKGVQHLSIYLLEREGEDRREPREADREEKTGWPEQHCSSVCRQDGE